MYNRILVPTDGSAGMTRVIQHAAYLADTHTTLHFLYVVNTASFANLPMETSWESVTSLLRDEGETALRAAEQLVSTTDVVTAIRDGPPSQEIIDYATEEDCDLIVMGTHGRGGLNRLLLGSVAERVIRTANIPVMTVRVTDHQESPPEESETQPARPDPSISEALE